MGCEMETNDDGTSRWSVSVGGATSVFGSGFLVGGELLLSATFASGDRVMLAREDLGRREHRRLRAGLAAAENERGLGHESRSVLLSSSMTSSVPPRVPPW